MRAPGAEKVWGKAIERRAEANNVVRKITQLLIAKEPGFMPVGQDMVQLAGNQNREGRRNYVKPMDSG